MVDHVGKLFWGDLPSALAKSFLPLLSKTDPGILN
jgi:hypothetical protein